MTKRDLQTHFLRLGDTFLAQTSNWHCSANDRITNMLFSFYKTKIFVCD
jgi:hypothetical protein